MVRKKGVEWFNSTMWLSSAPPPSTASSEPRNGINISGGNGNSGVPSTEDFSRQAHLSAELSKKVINMKELRSLALQSFSDSPGIRSTVWKLLLGYLPPERSLWSTELKQMRSQYKHTHYKDELLTTSELNNTPLRAERSQEATVYVGNLDPQGDKSSSRLTSFVWKTLAMQLRFLT
ncbi:hypothetical protein F2Q70_00020627 [Brassica cretica]|uniref:Rab-GAP TBC domain-containing protein n=1 Tax=Brassica cretica TaxID=69181 RepID=A0A8S9GL39_BRACR|nr:hypothetical protein F2Q70_00020627 [Brassica cretica]